MIIEIFTELQRLIVAWWRSDRIRVSPADGRLLRIQSGDVLTVAGTDVEVLERTIVIENGHQAVQLICRSESGLGVLYVTIASGEQTQTVFWNESESHRQLHDVDIQVWPRRQLA